MILTIFFVSSFILGIPLLNNPVLDHVVKVNETYEYVIPVDFFLSSKYFPVHYTMSTENEWLTQTNIKPYYVGLLFDLFGDAENLFLQDNLLYVANTESIDIFDVTNPRYLRRIGKYIHSNTGGKIFSMNSIVYIYLNTGMLGKFDFSDMTNPFFYGEAEFPNVKGITGRGEYLYVVSQIQLVIVDATTLEKVGAIKIKEGSVESLATNGIEMEDDLVYVVSVDRVITCINVSEPTNPFVHDFLDLDDSRFDFYGDMNRIHDFRKVGDFIYIYISSSYNDGYSLIELNITNGLSNGNFSNSYGLPETNFDTVYRILGFEVTEKYAYIQLGDYENSVRILDITTNPPSILGHCPTKKSAKIEVSKDDEYLFMADRRLGGVKTFNITNKSDCTLIAWYDVGYSVNQKHDEAFDLEIDHDQSVAILSLWKYGDPSPGAMYQVNVRAIDISDPTNIQQMGWIDGIETCASCRFTISDHILFFCTYESGLYAIDLNDPLELKLLSILPPVNLGTPSRCRDVEIIGELAVVIYYDYTLSEGRLRVHNISNIEQPETLSTIPIDLSSQYVTSVKFSGGYLYVASVNLLVVDVLTNPSNPVVLEDKDISGYARSVDVLCNSSIIIANDNALFMEGHVHIIDPKTLDSISSVEISHFPKKMLVKGSTGFVSVTGNMGGFSMIDLGDISNPLKVFEDITGSMNGIATDGNYVYVPDNLRNEIGAIRIGEVKISGTPTQCGDFEVVIQGKDYGDCVLDNVTVRSMNPVNHSFIIHVRKDGYLDKLCSVYLCPTGNMSNSTANLLCSGHGICDRPNHCECDEGYFGTFCESWTCQNVDYTVTDTVCSSHGVCIGYDSCVCDSTNSGEYYDFYGRNCEIKIGRQLVRSTKNILMGYFELSLENLLDIYGLEVDKEFKCSKFFSKIEGRIYGLSPIFQFWNCSLSRMKEFFPFPGFTQYIKIFIDHIPEEVFLDFSKTSSSYSSNNDDGYLLLTNFNNTISMDVVPGFETLSSDSYFTIKTFSQGDISDSSDSSLPHPESQFCKSKLFVDDQCIRMYSCYESSIDKSKSFFSHFSIGFAPSTEDGAFKYAKFYFQSEEECEISTEFEEFKTFSAVSCYGSTFGDNFMMYSRCSDDFMSILFNSNVLRLFLFSFSPCCIWIIIFVVVLYCCFQNACLFCIRGILVRLGIWKRIFPWYKKSRKSSTTKSEIKEEVDMDDDIFETEEGTFYTSRINSDEDNDCLVVTSFGQVKRSCEDKKKIPINDIESDEEKEEQSDDTTTSCADEIGYEKIVESLQREEEDGVTIIESGAKTITMVPFSGEVLREKDEEDKILSSAFGNSSQEEEEKEEKEEEGKSKEVEEIMKTEKEYHVLDLLRKALEEYKSSIKKMEEILMNEKEDDDDDDDQKVINFSQLHESNNIKVSQILMNNTKNKNEEEEEIKRMKQLHELQLISNDLLFVGESKRNKKLCKCWFCCYCCCCTCARDFIKCLLMIIFILLKDGLALWFSSSEFLDNADVDRANKDYVILTTILSINQTVIWVCIGIYIILLFLFICIYVERFLFDPLHFCIAYGSLKEYFFFRLFKSSFLLFFICINLFCYITKFAFLDEYEKANQLVSPNFYLGIALPESLLIFTLLQVLSYNGVSSFAMYNRMKKLGNCFFCCSGGLKKFPKVNIGVSKVAMDTDVIIEDFFQLLFLFDMKVGDGGMIQDKDKIVDILSGSEEYGHLSWEFLDSLTMDEMIYLRKFFFPEQIVEESYSTVFQYSRIASVKWFCSLISFPLICCVGSSRL